MKIPSVYASTATSHAGPTLIEGVRAACRRLASAGWKDLLDRHGLDIEASDLAGELSKPLPQIDRTIPGFEDFALEARRAIEPGKPAHSLLFHALASPHVVRGYLGTPLTAFPEPAELEAVENYVYGVSPPSIQDLRARGGNAPLAMVVFAAEYRPAINTVHQRHADMCFSRTGISRIGTADCLYLGEARGYLPFVDGDEHGIRVTPCRFVPYLAVQLKGVRADFGPMRFRSDQDVTRDIDGAIRTVHLDGDDHRSFWVPLHKLFSGKECLRGVDLTVTMTAHHVNQKLRKVHQAFAAQGFDTGWHEPHLSQSPFVFFEGLAEFSSAPEDGSSLLVPQPHARLVEPAMDRDGKIVSYMVPKPKQGKKNETFSSSLEVSARRSGARSAPEYVHARHAIGDDGTERNLNREPDVESKVAAGGYRAKHYVDFTGDGWVAAECAGISLEVPRSLPAYSLIAPPDFFPAVKQQELMQWWDQAAPPELASHVWPKNPGPPETLSDIRYSANLTLVAEDDQPIFDSDPTISAIVSGRLGGNGCLTRIDPATNIRSTSLPDGAAGVFAPGWDTSIDRTDERDPSDDGILVLPGVTHLSGYGLGSPFPEDAKLCAALSSFWPAAAPDVSRTFEPRNYATATPLPDEIIGQGGGVPWDGVRGPGISGTNPQEVEYTALAYGDYVEAALDGRFTPSAIARTTATEYVARTLAMARVYQLLEANTTEEKSRFGVFSFVPVRPGLPQRDAAEKAAGVQLSADHTYRFAIYRVGNKRIGTGPQFDKIFVSFDEMEIIFADPVHAVRFSGEDKQWYAEHYR